MFGFLRKTWKAPNGALVARKEICAKLGPTGEKSTYEVWTAPDAESAKAYLNSRSISKPFYYVVVETPQGNWGKDKMGVYKE